MALTTLTLSTRLGSNFAKETSATATKSVIATSSITLFGVEIDNTANSAASYLKGYDNVTGSVTVGTNNPDLILPAAASTKITYMFDQGVAFGTGLVLACVTGAGTAGTSSPASAVIIKLVYD